MSEKKKVLIIEDEVSAIELFSMMMEKYTNLELLFAVDGHKGFELAKLEKPDLIILDNRMPTVTGEQTAKMLRHEPVTKNIPILMITALNLSESSVNLIKMDVDEYIQKPISPWALKNKLERYLGHLDEGLL